jgi:hypothetical protein
MNATLLLLKWLAVGIVLVIVAYDSLLALNSDLSTRYGRNAKAIQGTPARNAAARRSRSARNGT